MAKLNDLLAWIIKAFARFNDLFILLNVQSEKLNRKIYAYCTVLPKLNLFNFLSIFSATDSEGIVKDVSDIFDSMKRKLQQDPAVFSRPHCWQDS